MSNFRVGQKVVCIDEDTREADGKRRLSRGVVYTVAAVREEYSNILLKRVRGGPVIWLSEITRPAGMPYAAVRFRPVVDRKTDISCFTKLLKTKSLEELAQ